MRVLLRIILTLLVAVPVVLGFGVFLALQVLQGGARVPRREEFVSPARGRLGQERTPT